MLQIRRIRVVTVADVVDVDAFGQENPLLEGMPEEEARKLYESIEGRPWTATEAVGEAQSPFLRGTRRG